MSDTAAFGYTQMTPEDTGSDFNSLVFVINQILGKVRTATIVQVKSCTNIDGVAKFGFVNAQPMISYVDGNGNARPHGTLFNLPYFRYQAGTNAIIMDPKVGDIGIALICDRDTSMVEATQAVGPPGSSRMFDLADGIYIGGILNPIPLQYIQFDNLGNLNLTVAGFVNITAPGGLKVNGVPVTVP